MDGGQNGPECDLVLALCFPCSHQQIQVLEKMTVERMSAERSECVQRVEQLARKERLETERRQVRAGRKCERFFREMYQNLSGFKFSFHPETPRRKSCPALSGCPHKVQTCRCVCVFCEQETLMRDLKRWCLAQLHSMEVRLAGEPSGTKLPPSSSAAEGADEDEGAGPTVPRSQGTQPLDLHGHTVQLGEEEPSVAEAGAANHYFVVHVESSPGNQIHLNPPVWLFLWVVFSYQHPKTCRKLQNVGFYCPARGRAFSLYCIDPFYSRLVDSNPQRLQK